MVKTKKKKTRVKKQVDPREQLTWKYWIIGALILAVIVGVVALCIHFAMLASVRQFSENDGILTRLSDGTLYMKADEVYEVLFPVSSSEKGTPYGEAEGLKLYEVGYFNSYAKLKKMDPDFYLTDGTYLYLANTVMPPRLSEFAADTVRIGEFTADEKTRVYLTSLTNESSPLATEFVAEYLKGERYTGDAKVVKTYCVQLTSAKYNYLAYMMYLVECEDGSWYLYSKENIASIKMSAEWFKDLVKAPEDSATTTS